MVDFGMDADNTIIGLEFSTTIVGLIGGIFALTWLPSMSLLMRVSSAAFAAILAGYLSPVISSLMQLIPIVNNVAGSIKYLIALCIGYSAHGIILPKFRQFLSKFLKKKSDEATK